MSRKRKSKMNEQEVKKDTNVSAEPRKIIGTNPDGTPIYEEEFTQTPVHTGEANPT